MAWTGTRVWEPLQPPTVAHHGRSDLPDPSLKALTIPELEGKPSWEWGNHRQPKGLKWLYEEPQRSRFGMDEVKWVVFVDDDTWVNVESLHGALRHINPHTRVAMGSLFHHVYSDTAHFSGGGGFVTSATLARDMAESLYITDGCQPRKVNGAVWNDVFMSTCLHSLRAIMVHSAKFHPGNVAWSDGKGGLRVDPATVLDAWTVHKVFGPAHAFYSRIQREYMPGNYPTDFGSLPVPSSA